MDRADAWAMVETMARMQEAHNAQVHPEWRHQGYEYYRAVWVECAELLDHFGWKWWKHQQPDTDQVKLEVVDIWHFGLSDLMRADALDATHDDAGPAAAGLEHLVDLGDVEGVRLADRRGREVVQRHEAGEPGDAQAHGNCSRKRWSPLWNQRMSSMA